MPLNIIARIVANNGWPLQARKRFVLTAKESPFAKASFGRCRSTNSGCVILESVVRTGVESQVLRLVKILERYESLALLRPRTGVSVTISIAMLAPKGDVEFRLRPGLLARIARLGFTLEGIAISMRRAEIYRSTHQ